MTNLTLIVLEGTYAVCRSSPDASIPAWATAGPFVSITRTEEELSIVCPDRDVPIDAVSERGWRCLRVAARLDFSLVGVLASLLDPLAEAGIPVFAVSTFDTDYLLTRAGEFHRAVEVLRGRAYDRGHGALSWSGHDRES